MLQIYKIPNPARSENLRIVAEKIEFDYSDQKEFPPISSQTLNSHTQSISSNGGQQKDEKESQRKRQIQTTYQAVKTR